MGTLTKRLLAAAALAAVTLCVSAASAQRGADRKPREGRSFLRVSEIVSFEGLDVERRGGEVVGVTVVQKDGTRRPLKQQTGLTCSTGCPAGRKLRCWEDEKQQMSMCECRGISGGAPVEFIVVGSGAGGGPLR